MDNLTFLLKLLAFSVLIAYTGYWWSEFVRHLNFAAVHVGIKTNPSWETSFWMRVLQLNQHASNHHASCMVTFVNVLQWMRKSWKRP